MERQPATLRKEAMLDWNVRNGSMGSTDGREGASGALRLVCRFARLDSVAYSLGRTLGSLEAAAADARDRTYTGRRRTTGQPNHQLTTRSARQSQILYIASNRSLGRHSMRPPAECRLIDPLGGTVGSWNHLSLGSYPLHVFVAVVVRLEHIHTHTHFSQTPTLALPCRSTRLGRTSSERFTAPTSPSPSSAPTLGNWPVALLVLLCGVPGIKCCVVMCFELAVTVS